MLDWTDITEDHYVTNTDQAKARSRWTTYAAVDQRQTSLTVDSGHNMTVYIWKTCQSHVTENSVICFTSLQ